MASKKNQSLAPVEEIKTPASVALNALSTPVPDYLKDVGGPTGLEDLGREDFKTPRIINLQALSPQVQQFRGKALPGDFWHTSANVSLGTEFNMVILKAFKRAILWRPRWEGGGMLAFSSDTRNWDMGGSQTFKIRPSKDSPDTVEWRTGASVPGSRLLNWGTFDTRVPQSPPAATLSYEYLIYMPDFPQLSPVIMGCYKTAIGNARTLQGALLQRRKPTHCSLIRCFSDEQSDNSNNWTIPNFEITGWVDQDLFNIATELKTQFADFQIKPEEYSQEDTDPNAKPPLDVESLKGEKAF